MWFTVSMYDAFLSVDVTNNVLLIVPQLMNSRLTCDSFRSTSLSILAFGSTSPRGGNEVGPWGSGAGKTEGFIPSSLSSTFSFWVAGTLRLTINGDSEVEKQDVSQLLDAEAWEQKS